MRNNKLSENAAEDMRILINSIRVPYRVLDNIPTNYLVTFVLDILTEIDIEETFYSELRVLLEQAKEKGYDAGYNAALDDE